MQRPSNNGSSILFFLWQKMKNIKENLYRGRAARVDQVDGRPVERRGRRRHPPTQRVDHGRDLGLVEGLDLGVEKRLHRGPPARGTRVNTARGHPSTSSVLEWERGGREEARRPWSVAVRRRFGGRGVDGVLAFVYLEDAFVRVLENGH